MRGEQARRAARDVARFVARLPAAALRIETPGAILLFLAPVRARPRLASVRAAAS